MNLLNRGHSGKSRNAYGANQGMKEDDSQNDLHPEASTSQSQTPRNSGPDDAYVRNFINANSRVGKKSSSFMLVI